MLIQEQKGGVLSAYTIKINSVRGMAVDQINVTEGEIVELYIALLEITKNRSNEREKPPSSETHPLVEAVRQAFA